MPLYSTAHLDLLDSGLVWLRTLAPDATLTEGLCCRFVPCPRWPEGLGIAPDWFTGEVDELADWWAIEKDREDGEGR